MYIRTPHSKPRRVRATVRAGGGGREAPSSSERRDGVHDAHHYCARSETPMKAAVYDGNSTALSLEEVQPNPPGPRDDIVEIGASCVFHSGLSILRGYVSVPACMVLGCGGVGQAVIQGARIAGAGRIIAIDPQELKRRTAKQLGATDVLDPSKGDPVEHVKALTGGRGADYGFEVIGLPETILTTYNLARRGGEVIIVGMARFDAQFSLPAFGIFFEEKTVKGCKYGSAQVRRDFPRFVELIETERLDTSSMVSKTITLEDVNDAFRAMEAGEVIRSVII